MSRRAFKATRGRSKARVRSHRRNHLSIPASVHLQYAYPVPHMGLGFGISPKARRLRSVILHVQTGYFVDPARGQVFGRTGELVGGVCSDGYVRLHGVVGMPQTVYAHRLVWETVNGTIPEGFHVDHKNAVRWDNRGPNLQAITQGENNRLTYERGGRLPGVGVHNAKLTDAKVRRIRSNPDMPASHFAALYDVGVHTIRDVRRFKTWKHVRPGAGRTRRSKRKQ